LEVKETMARYTTEVIAPCALSINSKSLKDPDAEFRSCLRNIFEFSVKKGLAMLTAFFAPFLKFLLRLKFVDDNMSSYVR
jgi:cytochrome P450 family 6